MAAIVSLPLTSFPHTSQPKIEVSSSSRHIGGCSLKPLRHRIRSKSSTSNSNSPLIKCTSSHDVPTVWETKLSFLKAYKKPIPSVYSTVLQELIVQQHLTRYRKWYRYDPVFALGFVTIYDQLMEGYPSGDQDRDKIFKAYVQALKEDPQQYRADAQKLEEWARNQNASSLVEFPSRDGEIERILKDISERAGNQGFSYSRFFAVGLFRILELANATEPTVLEKLCVALKIDKRSVDRDLDIYRNLLSKLVQSKELLKEYVNREKKKREERAQSQKSTAAITSVQGEYELMRDNSKS